MITRLFSLFIIFGSLVGFTGSQLTPFQNQLEIYKSSPISNTDMDEEFPDVAYCPGSGQYLVVFLKDKILTGQRLDGSGNILGFPFTLTSPDSGDATEPTVSCLSNGQEYFVAAWGFHSSETKYDIQIQAVYGNHQSESATQLFGDLITIGELESDEIHPAIACSSTANNCLVTYIFMDTTIDIRVQRVEINNNGIGLLGDVFDLPMGETSQTYNTITWNSIDDNYLIVWEQLSDNWVNDGIAFSHINASEQGPGRNELQHPPLWLAVPLDATRSFGYPVAAFNPMTGKFLVVFESHDKVTGNDHELLFQRVDGTGTGLEGPPVRLSDYGNINEAASINFDIGYFGLNEGTNMFLLNVLIYKDFNPPTTQAFLVKIKGMYDPESLDQLEGERIRLGSGGIQNTNGIENSSDGKYLLVVEELTVDNGDDLTGYLFAQFVYRFPFIMINY